MKAAMPKCRYIWTHRLPKLKSRLFDVFLRALRAADSTYVVYARFFRSPPTTESLEQASNVSNPRSSI